MRIIKEPGTFRRLLSEMGGRSWLLATGFVMSSMFIATGLLFRAEFTPDHWLTTIKWCVAAIGLVVGKRVVEEFGDSFGKNGCD